MILEQMSKKTVLRRVIWSTNRKISLFGVVCTLTVAGDSDIDMDQSYPRTLDRIRRSIRDRFGRQGLRHGTAEPSRCARAVLRTSRHRRRRRDGGRQDGDPGHDLTP